MAHGRVIEFELQFGAPSDVRQDRKWDGVTLTGCSFGREPTKSCTLNLVLPPTAGEEEFA